MIRILIASLGITLFASTVMANDQDVQSARANAMNYAQIEELREQVKGMRGDIEQLQFDNARLNEKLVKFSADIEFRISELQKKPNEASKEDKILDNIDKNLDNDVILEKSDANKASKEKKPEPQAQDDTKKTGDAVIDKKVKEMTMEQSYQDAYSILKEKDYLKARTAFSKFVEKYPDSELTGSARYWLGETYFLKNEYDKSAIEYLKGYQSNIRGSRAADNLLKLGKSLAKLEKRKEACTTFIKLKKEFPNAPSSIKKQMNEDMKTLRCNP
jgi:tol-pal system protein YbgF